MRGVAVALFIFLSMCSIAGASNVYETPNFQFAHGTGIVSVWLSPTEPVKGWEFMVMFDPTKIQVSTVAEGNFFHGFQRFFSPNMIIDNVNGSVRNLYCLVLGQGNTTGSGCLVTIIFTTLNVSGVSPISLVDVGVANETRYMPVQVQNASVQVYGQRPPWDTNGDGHVNHMDLSCVVSHYMLPCEPGDPWDVKIDSIVNVYDISVLVSHYGE